MNISQKERLEVLLKQIGMPHEVKEAEMNHAYLNKLTVLKDKKMWQFHIHNEKPFSFETFQLFSVKLKDAFHHIANVELIISTEHKEIDEENLLK